MNLAGRQALLRGAFRCAAVLCSVLATAGFLSGKNNAGLPADPASHAAPDALDTLADSLSAGSWQKLHDDAGQAGGIRDVLAPQTTATFAINHDGQDWTADWSPWPWTSTTGRDIIKAWNGGAVVDKSGHVRFYIPGAGGHTNYGGNEVYSFDLLAAADAINRGSRQGTEQWWQMAYGPARLGEVHDGTNYHRPFNLKGPYYVNHSTVVFAPENVRWVPFNPDDPFGDDQCNIGPPSTHLYGGVEYHEFYDAIVVHGAGVFSPGGTSPRGIWLFDIQGQEWTLLPDDRDPTPPYDCSGTTAGDILFEEFYSSNASNVAIIMYADERMWIGNRHNSFRWRTDDVAWTVNPEAGHNNHAQKTGSAVPHPTKTRETQNGTYRAIGGPHNGNLAAWIFYEDASAGGTTGFAEVWPNIDQDDTSANMTYVDYVNNMPNSGGNLLPDLTSGIYSATHNKFFFIHRPWLADFKGQVYAFDLTTEQWETYIDPASDPSNPSQAENTNANGTWGRFAYMESRNLFLLIFDPGEVSVGPTGQVYLLKGI